MSKKVKHAVIVMFLDLVILNAAYFFAFLLRFDLHYSMIPEIYIEHWMSYALINSALSIMLFNVFNMYDIIWRYISINESIKVCVAVTLSFLANTLISHLINRSMPIAVYFIAYGTTLIGILGIRYGFRIYVSMLLRQQRAKNQLPQKNVMVIGAGEAGRMLIRDMKSTSKINMDICCVIDDNDTIKGRSVEGVTIVGGRNHILSSVEKYDIDTILIAIPSATPQAQREILEICKMSKCELKILPGMYQLVNDNITINNLRNVNVEDLLGREPIRVNSDEIFEYVSDKVILVTGGGGSIGSELCRQIAEHNPRQLIILDIYENNAYDIQQEILTGFPQMNLKVLIASVRDSKKIDRIFKEYKPQIVFHAAAHKHVPLMEDAPAEAIKNNVFGTYNVAMSAIKYGVAKFVLISTDKAVNPTNIMGASKRLCEMIVQGLDKTTNKTSLVAVRFGNVLGSNGSVIPLFKKQIENGGPVTVTDPNIIRFFMTIPEAVSLVLQAGAYAKGGEIFILNMGAPVKIDDLAKNLIRLSGYTPGVDIEIVYTGLRPGEKLYEELLMDEEGKMQTANNLIYIGHPIEMDEEVFWDNLEMLRTKANENVDDMKEIVAKIVPTYKYK